MGAIATGIAAVEMVGAATWVAAGDTREGGGASLAVAAGVTGAARGASRPAPVGRWEGRQGESGQFAGGQGITQRHRRAAGGQAACTHRRRLALPEPLQACPPQPLSPPAQPALPLQRPQAGTLAQPEARPPRCRRPPCRAALRAAVPAAPPGRPAPGQPGPSPPACPRPRAAGRSAECPAALPPPPPAPGRGPKLRRQQGSPAARPPHRRRRPPRERRSQACWPRPERRLERPPPCLHGCMMLSEVLNVCCQAVESFVRGQPLLPLPPCPARCTPSPAGSVETPASAARPSEPEVPPPSAAVEQELGSSHSEWRCGEPRQLVGGR